MKILIFSDTHLYLPFNEKKYNFLKKIIEKSDRVIINGDFFDDYMTDFNKFVSSPWSQLFPLLKSKKTVYIYGNHDKRAFSDKRVDLFSDIQAERYKIKTPNKTFNFEHGHKTRATPDTSWKLSKEVLHYGDAIGHFFRRFMVKIFGNVFIVLRFAYRNPKSKRKIAEMYKPQDNEIYIIGHNHFGEVDEKSHFAASGMILYGFASYLTIENDKIMLHEEWYE